MKFLKDVLILVILGAVISWLIKWISTPGVTDLWGAWISKLMPSKGATRTAPTVSGVPLIPDKPPTSPPRGQGDDLSGTTYA